MRTWPADYDSECYVLLPVPVATVPIVAGKIGELENRSEWATDADWESGYQFAACLQECLMQCGQSFAETMTLLAVALGANEVDQADLAPVFPALAERLAAARSADTAGVLGKAAATAPPSAMIRLSELLAPFVQAGNPAWPADPNVWGMLRSTWNFGAYWSTDAGTNGATEATTREIGALLAVLAGLQEQAIADIKTVWPNVGNGLEAAQGREDGGGTTLLVKSDAADTGQPSAIVRLSEIARLLSGKFPDTGTLWWYEAGQSVTLYDLYKQHSGLTDGPPPGDDGVNWVDYVSDLIGIPTDMADLFSALGFKAGNIKKDGLMLASIAVQYMNLAMNTSLLLNLIGKDKITDNSPGAPAATHDYLEALLKATRGAGIQRSETDWAGALVGAGLAPDGTPPGDSVLQGIRGDTEASATRNIIDTQPDVSALTTIDTKLDALLQGSALGDGRVNLWTLDQSIDALLTEMQVGQIFSKLDLIEYNVAIAVDGGQHTGKINLRDVKAEIEQVEAILGDVRGYLLGIEGDTMAMQPAVQAIQTAVDFILAELNKLMDTSGYTDRTNLHDLLDQLMCICNSTRNLVILQPQQEPYGIDPESASSSAGSVDCQRVRWLLDSLRVIGEGVFARMPVTKQGIQDAYQRTMGVMIGGERSSIIARMANDYMMTMGVNWIAWSNWFTTIEGILRCELYNGASPSASYDAWNVAMDQLGAGGTHLASILKLMLWGDILNDLFSGALPLNSQDLTPYSSDCSDCSGGGVVLPDAPPGGWDYVGSYSRTGSTNSPNAHPTLGPEWVAFWWETTDGTRVDTEQTRGWTMPDRWTVSSNLRGYKIYPNDSVYVQTTAEIYDNGVLIATVNNSVYTVDVDTTSVMIKITSGFPGSVNVRNPSQASGWPFP